MARKADYVMWEVFVLMILFIGGSALSSVQQRDRRLEAWQEAAASCGLQVTEISSFGWSPTLKARAGAIEVGIRTTGDKERPIRIKVVVTGPPDFYKVRIHPESLRQSEIEIGNESFMHQAREIEIGDEAFDRKFFLGGPPSLVLALLDADTRRLLVRVQAESQLEISVGTLRADMFDKKVLDVLPLLLDIGRRFAQVDIPRRLAENAKQDPEVGVRLQNLSLLIHEFPGKPGTIEALRTACSDLSSEIRLRAAKALGAEGRKVLWKLAESEVNDASSAEAVSAVGRELGYEHTAAILGRALSQRRIRTARACLEVLSMSGAAEAVDTLAKVMAQEKGELAVAAAEALESTDSPAAEPSLIVALLREQSDLQVAAAKALGRIGSVAAVLPLKEATERHWLDRELRRAARQAIAEIQSRIQGASPGQLSIAGAEVGQLSLAQAEAGQLSLATSSSGQLSLGPDEDLS